MRSLHPPKPLTTISKSHSNPRAHFSTNLPCIVQAFCNLVSEGQLRQAVLSLDFLSRKGIRLPSQTLAYILQQCGNTKSLKLGKWVHTHLKLTGLKRPNTFLANNLIMMYWKCGDHVNAYKVFDEMPVRNLYSWNNMVSGYAKLGMMKPARKLFDEMSERDIVSWNTMVTGYAKSGFCGEALKFYREFRRSGIGYNEYSFAGLLTVCVNSNELRLTWGAHGQVFMAGFLSNVVTSSSLVNAYAKCQEMDDARRLFDEMHAKDVCTWTIMVSGYAQKGDMEAAVYMFDMMPEKNPVSWTSLISGYSRHGLGHEALELFTKMIIFGIRPDQFTFSSCLCACASIASLSHGKQIHDYLIRMNFMPNTIVVSSLIDMYSKCGCLEAGGMVFYTMGNKQDVVLWNTMISALAQHSYCEEAIQMFDDMVRSGMQPNRITFVVILSACSHSGLVQEGLTIFESMTREHGLLPDQEHYGCLIDLLGRAGRFDILMKELEKMQCYPNDQIWNALASICSIHGNTELGSRAAELLMELKPQPSAAYVNLSSTYTALAKWEMVEKTRQLVEERSLSKEQAISWIEIGNKVHSFTVSDRVHPLKDVIYSVLDQLACQMKEIPSSYTQR